MTMTAPATPIWDLEPHTQAKHIILRKYLDQWLPILSLGGFPSVIFIDGFAGPGIYEDGSDGSPIIALKAFLDHPAPITAQVHFHFVEQHPKRADILRREISRLLDSRGKPANMHCTVYAGETFEQAYRKIVSVRETSGAPIFALIDPFGWTGAPMSIIADILKRQSCEVLMNFMFEEVNRFLSKSDQADNFDALFGSSEWRVHLESSGHQRKVGVRECYGNRLITSGARFVRYFEMCNQSNATDYFLFFATKSPKGLVAMKRAMWKVDDSGAFKFSDATNQNQLILLGNGPNPGDIERQMVQRFRGQAVKTPEISKFIVEETAYLDTHFKSVLKAMEEATPPKIEIINPPQKRRRGTFSDEVVVRFL
jgi:three-Cys-motif partner protein